MTVSATEEAFALVRRSLELAGLDPSEAGVRLRLVGHELMPRLAREPGPDDEVLETGGVRIFVERRVVERHPDAEIAVSEEHERLVLRPRSEDG